MGLAKGAEPVVDDADLDPLKHLGHEGTGEALPHLVVVHDVVFEMDDALGPVDRVQPGRVVLRGVAQEAYGVPPHQGRSRGAREDLVAELAEGIGIGHLAPFPKRDQRHRPM